MAKTKAASFGTLRRRTERAASPPPGVPTPAPPVRPRIKIHPPKVPPPSPERVESENTKRAKREAEALRQAATMKAAEQQETNGLPPKNASSAPAVTASPTTAPPVRQPDTRASSPLSDISSNTDEDSDDDNIQVRSTAPAQVSDGADDDDDPTNDIDMLEKQVEAGKSNPGANRPWARSGKQPMRDSLSGADNPVVVGDDTEEEYEHEDIDEGEIDYNDHTPSEHELDPEDDVVDDADVIELSSDEEGGAKKKSKKKRPTEPDFTAILERPWLAQGFTREMREHWEKMFHQPQTTPIAGSWDYTEDYQCEKDKEMLRYIQDFPLDKWVIPSELATQAIAGLHERSRWRALGIRIYTPDPRRMDYPQGMPPPYARSSQDMRHPQMGMPGPAPNGYGRHPSMSGPPPGSRPPSVPQQNMAHPPPPNGQHMMPPPTPGQQMPPPQQVLRSQPHAMPTNVPPTQGGAGMPPGQRQHSGQPQMMAPVPFGHPSAVGGQYAMPQGMPYHVAQQQYPTGPNGQAVPHGYPMPQNVGPGPMQPGMNPHGHGPMPAQAPYRPRGRKNAKVDTPPPPAKTPPYEARGKPPADRNKKPVKTPGKRNARKQAEADLFPWQRQIDFKLERQNAMWDTSRYDPRILDEMAEVRRLNMPVIQRLDEELAEKQKVARNRKRQSKGTDDTPGNDNAPDGDGQQSAEGTPRPRGKGGNPNIGGDPYYSGNFSFATEADRDRASHLGCKTPDELIDRAEAKSVDWELTKDIRICWNPGKKGTTQELVQASFRVYDTLITREQYDHTLILTKRAAECLVDFCPDMLWRECLLRIVSEAGYGNKDVRDRFCYNGCYSDKATVTKRIAAALGQKQQSHPKRVQKQADTAESSKDAEEGASSSRRGPKGKADRYLEGEEEWHYHNKEDFEQYIAFFGKRLGSRRKPKTGDKRKADEDGEPTVGGDEGEGSNKRAKTQETEGSPEADGQGHSSDLSEADDETEDEGDDGDAVSEQSDGVLDEIED